ncbi:heterokaryon incompatibility protein-domain-containing protein [Immersiella caudata]|uniref:Heterokaryon incompatibility protein-domain-containing protein n=1 Tax=Immersiella caudata TaxID=314043 RepID=A0AA40BZX9_9PEZI|nr:heterokaryon incompatibility protein-domain-containing protein [Immersiella caudata]
MERRSGLKGYLRRRLRRILDEDEDDVPFRAGPSRAEEAQTSLEYKRIPVADINPLWIDLVTVHAWMSACDELHDCAQQSDFGDPPTWLIDIEDECLVAPPSTAVRYFALSYVWGEVKTTKLTTTTIHAFCQPGVFSATNNTDVHIPKTIRHAIGLVKALGERYLWVDALCIAQDDDANFHNELRNMGAIYHKAYATVVAATAWDADEGLRGLEGISPPRHIASNFADDLHKYLDPQTMIWNSRGWTFQEGQLSRRMLMFCGHTAIWRCTRCTIDESGCCQTLSKEAAFGSLSSLGAVNKGGFETLPVSSASKPCLQFQLHAYFKDVVAPYNTRSFTQESDLPRAFAGIAHFLEQNAAVDSIFRDGFSWGLPLANFAHGLTWCTSNEDLRPRSTDLGIPSWSWLAWEGNIIADPMNLDFDDIESGTFAAVGHLRIQWNPSNIDIPVCRCSHASSGDSLHIVAQRCNIRPEFNWKKHAVTLHRTNHPILHGEHAMEIAFLIADRPGDIGDPSLFPDSYTVELVAVRKFEAYLERWVSGKRVQETATYIRALWIAPQATASGDFEGHGTLRARRQGVAIVEEGLWERNVRGGGKLLTVIE